MNAINYEDVVENALLDGLQIKFNTNNTNNLIKYLFARCALLHGVDSIKDATQFIGFILHELGIPYLDVENNRAIEFNGDSGTILITSGYASHNSLLNIFDSIESQFANETFLNNQGDKVSPKAYIKSLVSDIQKQAKQKLKPYKNSHYVVELQTLFKLQTLNEIFCIKTPVEAPAMTMFNQRDSRTSIDTLYERYLHAENFDTTNVHSVTEAQVRDYLYSRLDLIEDGLKPLMKEFPTKEGRVDIVAKDKEDNLVVIELKTENDKRLIWQCMYYPDEVKRKLGAYDDKKVRMLTVAPEYPEFIQKPIEKLGYVESYTYTLKAFNNIIEEVSVKKCEKTKDESQNEEGGVGDEIQRNLDNLINVFTYAKEKLEEKCGNSVKNVEDVVLRLIEISMINDKYN